MGITSEEGNGMKIQRGVPVTSREWGFFVNCVVDTQVLIVHGVNLINTCNLLVFKKHKPKLV